jgi:predicted metalloendopeptidase
MDYACLPQDDPNCYFNTNINTNTVSAGNSAYEDLDVFEKIQYQIDQILLSHIKSDEYFKILRKSFDQRNTFTNSYDIFAGICKGVFGICNPTLYANLTKSLIIRGFVPIHNYNARANSLPQTDTYIPAIGEFCVDPKRKRHYDSYDISYANDIAESIKPYAGLVKMLYAERPNFVKNVLETEILFSKANKPKEEIGLATRDKIISAKQFFDLYDKMGIWRIILPQSKWIHVENESYALFLDNYFSEASWEKIQDYLVYSILSKYEPYLDSKKRTAKSEDKLFLNFCKECYGAKLQQIYESEVFPDKDLYTEGIKNLCFELKTYCERNINFPTQATTAKARNKISLISIFVGPNPIAELFENVPENFVLSTTNFYENAINVDMVTTKILLSQIGLKINRSFPLDIFGAWSYDVNAFYDASSNSLYVPTGMFAKIFYYPGADPVHNFSGLGCIVGHEMMHCFDMYGSLYDGTGKLNTWWTEIEYNIYLREMLKIKNEQVGVPSALSESMADVYGIKLALKTYISIFGSSVDKIQYFFGHWARIMGTVGINEEMDVHSNGNYRVNISFAHIPEYYVAFNVKPNDKNYLKPKLRTSFFF